jgi:dCTP deaminase
MSLLADHQIRTLAEAGMISPYEPKLVREVNGKKVISYGQSSAGYDIRLSNKFKYLRCACHSSLDPKKDSSDQFLSVEGDFFWIQPNNFVLAVSVETFDIPKDIMVVAVGKSTLARCGLIANITPIEPGWKGFLTLEISNTTPCPVKVWAGEGIAQLLFYKLDRACDTSYDDRAGKYQSQTETPTVARL